MLTTRYQKVNTLNVQDITRMYELFQENYAFSPLSTFISDMEKKDGVFVVREKATNRIVGFSTLGIYQFKLGGRKAIGLFSGDTILERTYWGSRSLSQAIAMKMFWESCKHPFTAQYWTLLSKGYKTYLLVTNNFKEFYPNRKGNDPKLEAMVKEYSEALFPGKLIADKMILDFGPNANCLKEGVAGISDELRKHPDIAYFEQRNPTWHRGTELPCIARADFWTFLSILPPFLMKTMFGGRSRSATDAHVGAGDTANEAQGN
ncbi:MAG: hypothetical protein QM742_00235 [Aquabacterium sp.]